MTIKTLIDAACCPNCSTRVDLGRTRIHCSGCGNVYPRLGEIPILLPAPETYLASCRGQLARLDVHANKTVQIIEEQLRATDVLPLTRDRCRAMIEAICRQVTDIRSIVEPLLPAATSSAPDADVPEDFPAPLEYLHHLYRDWGWPWEPDGENERALASVDAVLEGQPLGRMLVLGAGACRLAYDLHRRDPTADTLVVDIDPFLFAVAHKVVRGGTVSLHEANWEIDEMGHVVREWELEARNGAIGEDRFHFMLADGLEPPLLPGTFDTVLTPWFIDLIPDDLRHLISTIHRLLKPGGRWLNLGPLRYTPDTPAAQRFTREEVFDLAGRAGFKIGKWQTDSAPYLVSKLNGRGKVEWVLSFGASKLDTATPDGVHDGDPPAWLIFHHLPIPTLSNESLSLPRTPLSEIVVPAIDGTRTLNDLASLVATEAGESGLSMTQIRPVVRRCLAELFQALH